MWDPPPNVFSEHELFAICRQNPVVKSYNRLSVQGFEFIAFNPNRRYDSSTAWVATDDNQFLCRVIRFVEVAPCCHPDCEPVVVVEIKRFEVKTNVRNGVVSAVMLNTAVTEYITASSLVPQVVLMVPTMKDTPVTSAERRAARHQMCFGPFSVIDIANKKYQ